MIKKIISGKLRALTGIHIGTGDRTETTDLPIFRDVIGDILIPGTAIAGALRTLTTRIAPHLGFDKCLALEPPSDDFCDCRICDLFGSINPSEDLDEEKAKASKIWVYNAVLTSDARTSIRDGVGIDRESKSSARTIRAKYDFEIVPKDSVFTFRIDLQDNVSREQECLLASILSEWSRGRGNLGGDVARGLGNMQLEDVKVYNLNLLSIDRLMTFLREDDLIKTGTEEKGWLSNHLDEAKKLIEKTVKEQKLNVDNDHLYNSFAQIDFTLQFTGGFVVNDILSSVRSNFDFCPKMENGNFVLPGSSLRGVLRSQAEKIARSLTTLNSKNGNDFLARCPACNPHADENSPLTSCNTLFRKNRKSPEEEVKDEQLCLACRLFGSSYKGSQLYIRDGYLPLSDKIEIKTMDFLAIDRFTGGGREGAKFDALALWQPTFKVSMLLENPKEWQLGWLLLVLRDLKEGLFSVGFGQNKWFGKTITKDEKIKIGTITNEYIPTGLKMNNSFDGFFNTRIWNFEELTTEPKKPVESWIKEFHNELQKFTRVKGMVPSSDTYFKEDIDKLYPREVVM
ncbi:MAG: RAMP superfamily CRISPR-associated protein [Candidatus Freyarchaeum deiterrae]